MPLDDSLGAALPGHCDKVVTKRGAQLNGRFCERIITPKAQLDRRSFRTAVFDGGARAVIIGCPKGHWSPGGTYKGKKGAGRCKVGTKAHAVLKRKGR